VQVEIPVDGHHDRAVPWLLLLQVEVGRTDDRGVGIAHDRG
jgi:hypothetical protein